MRYLILKLDTNQKLLRHNRSKKKAIEAAIEIAGGELIVATDADCILPPGWLQTIADFYKTTGAAFIAAPVKFTYNNSVLQRFQATDFLVLQGITAASVASGFHAMSNGANFCYTKKLYKCWGFFKAFDQVGPAGRRYVAFHANKIWKNASAWL